MSNIIIEHLSLPEPGRYLQADEDRGFTSSTNIQVSLNEVLRNRDAALQQQQQQQPQQQQQLVGLGRPLHAEPLSEELKAKIKAGKDIIWTTDIGVELPVKVAESGPAALPPQTIVEFFADCVRRFPDEPALLFEPHFPSSSSSTSSRNSNNSSNRGSSSGCSSSSCCVSPASASTSSCSSTSSAAATAATSAAATAATAAAAAAAFEDDDDGGTQRVCFPKTAPPNGSSSSSSSGGVASCCPPSYVAHLLPGWCGYTWQGYWSDCCFFAKSLLQLGAPPLCRVAIMGCNAPAWAISFYGSVFAGGVAVGVYTTNSAEACKYVIEHSQCFVAVVDTLENAQKMLQVRKHQLMLQQQQQQQQQQQGQGQGQQQQRQRQQPRKQQRELMTGGCLVLQQIVVYRDLVPSDLSEGGVVISFDDFLAQGRQTGDSLLSARMERQKPGACCTIVYTSGTTGPPKGVMLSHDNLTWTAGLMAQILCLSRSDRIVSLLPLSHVAAQVVDLVAPLIMGTAVFFARPDVLRGTLLITLLKVRPTWFLGVPRIYEKMEQRIKEVAARGSPLRKKLATAAKGIGLQGALAILEGRPPPWGFAAVNRLLLQQVRKALGFDRCNAWGSCAAPIDPQTQKYFLSLGMPINSLYGLSESSGPQTFIAPSPGWFKIGSIGHSLPGTDMCLLSVNSEGEGELCFRGRNIFMGYLGDDRATMETIDPQGFLHTGDLGRVDEDGFIYITGRAKELIITAGGENVAPVLIESTLKQEIPILSNCMVVGDRRKFLGVLCCLQTTRDKRDSPTQTLAPEVVREVSPLGSSSKTTTEAAEDVVINQIIQRGIEEANKKAISRAQRILAWRVLPVDFSVAGGELTATMKLKRKFVSEKYKKVIEKMYKEPHPPCLRAAAAAAAAAAAKL